MAELNYEFNLQLLFVIAIGLIFGSFATAVSYRLPREEEYITSRSRCPKCGHKLGVLDLIPFFSWLILRGKCRYCKSYVGSSYLLIESATAILFALVFIRYGISPLTLILWAVALSIVIMTVIDFEHYIIPDEINISLFALAIIYQLYNDAEWYVFFTGPVIGLTVGFALRIMIKIWKKQEGLGMGDVKFLAVAGLFLNLEMLVTFFFLSGLLGLVVAIIWKILGKGIKFPFGPALAGALFICLLYPEFHDYWRMAMQQFIVAVIS